MLLAERQGALQIRWFNSAKATLQLIALPGSEFGFVPKEERQSAPHPVRLIGELDENEVSCKPTYRPESATQSCKILQIKRLVRA